MLGEIVGNSLQVLESCKNGIVEIMLSKDITALVTFFGLTGFGLRDIKITQWLENLKNLTLEKLPLGLVNEKQETIFRDVITEVVESIVQNKNIDNAKFLFINNLIVNGVKEENILTVEYFRIMNELSAIDLEILLKASEISVVKDFIFTPYRIKKNKILKKIAQICSKEIPYELVEKSLEKLLEKKLILKEAKVEYSFKKSSKESWKKNVKRVGFYRATLEYFSCKHASYCFLTELGIKISLLIDLK